MCTIATPMCSVDLYLCYPNGNFYFIILYYMKKVTQLVDSSESLPGRDTPMVVSPRHFTLGTEIIDYPDTLAKIVLGLGCFWGAEKLLWSLPGVYSTAVGYAGGYTKNPTYEEVCSGKTAHTEVVLVVFDDKKISTESLLSVFWQEHDPTQGMRQGNDIGTQYRSAIYVNNESDLDIAMKSKEKYQQQLHHNGFPDITTDISINNVFYYAEEYHQQYLAKNPKGYCGLHGTGVDF